MTVNGQVETSPKAKIDEKQKDRIAQVKRNIDNCLPSLNKPQGVISATRDARLQTQYSVTQQDISKFSSWSLGYYYSGLLLLTNNSDSSHTISKKHVDKIYQTKVNGIMDQEDILFLKKGLSSKTTLANQAKLKLYP